MFVMVNGLAGSASAGTARNTSIAMAMDVRLNHISKPSLPAPTARAIDRKVAVAQLCARKRTRQLAEGRADLSRRRRRGRHRDPVERGGKFGAAVHAEFVEDAGEMRLDGRFAHAEAAGNFLVREAASGVTEHFPLARAEALFERGLS